MEQYVGLDVSQKETAVCVIDGEGKRVWQGTCRSVPAVMAEVVRTKAPQVVRVAMETGPLAVWHWHELKAAGVPIVCIHARHAKAALSMQVNKTDGDSRWLFSQGGGLALDRTLASRLASTALEQAIAKRQPPPGLVHHSDRGVQYASEQYIAILEKHGMISSMSRPANPYDNASCESFIKTLKREEIYANAYDDLEHLRANIEEFIERYYNRQRLHSALGYRSPEEFERQSECRSSAAESRSATMEFFENETKTSTEMLGTGTQSPSPSPDPISG